MMDSSIAVSGAYHLGNSLHLASSDLTNCTMCYPVDHELNRIET